MSGELVLVTGGSGFVGAHCILALLRAGYRVRTTVRSIKREPEVRAMLKVGGAEPGDALSFAIADLSSDEGWSDAVRGCTYVLHVASPFPASVPKHEDDLIIPAREGALRVLRAANEKGVKRVVLTSSFAAIGYGHTNPTLPYSERDWTDTAHSSVGAYAKSKTLAERAAWDFIKREGSSLELAVVNPTLIIGPVLGKDLSPSIHIVKRLLDGSIPGLPRLAYGIVDVRDVADLHLRAMADPAASGERFLALAGDVITMEQIARILKARLGDAASRVPTRVLPSWLVRAVALFDPALKAIAPELGKVKTATNEKACMMLGWSPRSNEDALVATAESLSRLGLLKHPTPRAAS